MSELKYNKHNFYVGQIFTADHANSLDDGIIANENNINLVKNALVNKLNKQQGAANKDKTLIVGDDGNVTLGDKIPQIDKTLTSPDMAAQAKAVGDKLTEITESIDDIEGDIEQIRENGMLGLRIANGVLCVVMKGA